jgi:hypothetical protein
MRVFDDRPLPKRTPEVEATLKRDRKNNRDWKSLSDMAADHAVGMTKPGWTDEARKAAKAARAAKSPLRGL